MERLRGHYRESLITPWLQLWSITPVKIDPRPRVRKLKKVEATLSSGLSLSLCGSLSLDGPASGNLSASAASPASRTKQAAGFQPFTLPHIFYPLFYWEGAGRARSRSNQRASIQEEPEQQRFQEQGQRGTKNLSINVRKRLKNGSFQSSTTANR